MREDDNPEKIYTQRLPPTMTEEDIEEVMRKKEKGLPYWLEKGEQPPLWIKVRDLLIARVVYDTVYDMALDAALATAKVQLMIYLHCTIVNAPPPVTLSITDIAEVNFNNSYNGGQIFQTAEQSEAHKYISSSRQQRRLEMSRRGPPPFTLQNFSSEASESGHNSKETEQKLLEYSSTKSVQSETQSVAENTPKTEPMSSVTSKTEQTPQYPALQTARDSIGRFFGRTGVDTGMLVAFLSLISVV